MSSRSRQSAVGSWQSAVGHPRLAVTAVVGLLLIAGPAVARAQRINETPQPVVPPTDLKAPVLRVCADPNNLPFSNGRREGFENKLAELVAADLGKRVAYAWWPQRRGFVRETLNAGRCDVIIGVPSGYELTLTTRPYYRSTYVFVSRRDRALHIRSLNDPRLRALKIGVHSGGGSDTASPAARALARRGIVANVHSFSIFGDYSKPSPPADLVRNVVDGKVDVAIGWGPLVGYFARHSPVPLDVVQVSPQVDVPFTPFVFDLAMGVRRNDTALRALLDQVIERRQADIDRLLERYGVPLLNAEGVMVMPPSRAAEGTALRRAGAR